MNGDGSQWLNLMSFYLYPTTIGKNNEAADNGGAGTQIVVRGTFKGQTVFVPVIVDRDVDILANTRYIITLDMASGRGTLQTVDWETGEQLGDNDLPAKPGENTEPADMLYIGGGSFTWDNTIHTLEVYSDNVTIQTSASFDAVSPFGTTFTVEHTVGGTDVSNTATAEVYSSSIQTTRAITLSTKERYLIKVPQGDTAIEATVTIHSNNNPEDDYVITVRRIPAGNANILHLDKDGALQVGNWTSGVVTLDNILMFKSGGVVGVGAAAVNDDLYDATKVLFNPASNVTPTDDWMSIPAFDVSDFVDEDNTYVNVESGYVTGTRIKEGKGDPCMLVGYTAQELRVMSESELDEVISNAEWRLPTSDEISTYVARSSNNDNSYWDATGINGFQGAWMPYNSITKTYGPDFYPAVGFRKPNSEGTNRGTTGAVNTSWASWTNQTTNNNGVYLGLLEQSLLTFIGNHDNSLTVRCVPNS